MKSEILQQCCVLSENNAEDTETSRRIHVDTSKQELCLEVQAPAGYAE